MRTEKPRLRHHPQESARDESPAARQLSMRCVGVEPPLKPRLQIAIVERERQRLRNRGFGFWVGFPWSVERLPSGFQFMRRCAAFMASKVSMAES